MRNIKIIFFVMFFFSACESEDTGLDTANHPIYGHWNLMRYEGGFSPDRNFSVGQISWLFNNENVIEVFVEASVSSSPVLPKGKYDFSVSKDSVVINGIKYGFKLSEDSMTISKDVTSDGPKLNFVKHK